MATQRRPYSELIRLLSPTRPAINNLYIVESTILHRVLSLVPEDAAARFLAEYGTSADVNQEREFGIWLKGKRTALELEQKPFAKALSDTGLTKVSQSDISNLERASGRGYFTKERRDEVQAATQVLMARVPRPT